MAKLRLDTEALEVTSFDTANVTATQEPVLRTGMTGYCNSCADCDWTV